MSRVPPEVATPDEKRLEASLRPRTFERVRRPDRRGGEAQGLRRGGQGRGATRSTTASSPGPPGLGKTSLAHIIAAELGVGLHVTSGPALERKGDLAGLLTNLQPRDVLFIDEIHRLHAAVEEYLYPAMEDFRLDITIDSGPAARAMKIDLPPFTLIGATTRTGPAHLAAARPLPDPGAARVLRARRILEQILDRSAPASSACSWTEDGAAEIATPLARHAPHRQPPAAPHPRLRRGGRGTAGSRARWPTRALERLEVDAERPRPDGPEDPPHHPREVRRRPGGRGDHRRQRGRAARDDGGRLRALPAAGGLPPPHAARPGGHRPRPAKYFDKPPPADVAGGAVLSARRAARRHPACRASGRAARCASRATSSASWSATASRTPGSPPSASAGCARCRVEGREELLFEFEMLLRGDGAVLQPPQPPHRLDGPAASSPATSREELRDVRDALDQAIKLARRLLDPGDRPADDVPPLRAGASWRTTAPAARCSRRSWSRTRPQESLFLLRQSFESLRTVRGLSCSSCETVSFRVFHEVGNLAAPGHRPQPVLPPLPAARVPPRVRPGEVGAGAGRAAQAAGDPERRLFTTVFLGLFRLLHYLAYVRADAPWGGAPARGWCSRWSAARR